MGVDVAHQHFRSAAQYRCAKEQMIKTGLVAGLEKIKIVPIRGKRKRIKRILRRRDNLGVAGSRNVAKPKAFEAVFTFCEEQIFAIGRNGCKRCGAGIGGLGDGELCEGAGSAVNEEAAQAEAGADDENKNDGGYGRCAEFVLLGDGGDGRAAGRMCQTKLEMSPSLRNDRNARAHERTSGTERHERHPLLLLQS